MAFPILAFTSPLVYQGPTVGCFDGHFVQISGAAGPSSSSSLRRRRRPVVVC